MIFVDSHAHITSKTLLLNATEIIERAKNNSVAAIINICTDGESLTAAFNLDKSLPIYHTAATTPHDVEKEGESFFPLVEKAAKEGFLVAIGETGLDYHYEHSNRECQKKWLLRYFDLAKKTKLPLVIHCREAFSDLFTLADLHYKNLPLLLHCFTGTLEEAQEVIKRGWFLSLSGILTFKNSHVLHNVAKEIPLEHLVIETDSPYLAPMPHRGKVNEPAFVKETARFLADIKKVSLEEVASVTTKNAIQFFSLPKDSFFR